MNNKNLIKIVDYYNEKFKILTEYHNIYKASVFYPELLVENFLLILLNYIEFKMILGIFDGEKCEFSEQEEILFIDSNINTNEYNFAFLNLNKFKIEEIFDVKEKNEERKEILNKFKANLKIYEKNLEDILQEYLKIDMIKDEKEDFLNMFKKNSFNFINLYLKMFNELDWDNFLGFLSDPKMKKIFLEFLISIKIYLSKDNLKNFNNLKEISYILNPEEKTLKISLLEPQNTKIFFSCLGGLFRFFQNYSKEYKININSIFDKNNNYKNYLINYPTLIK